MERTTNDSFAQMTRKYAPRPQRLRAVIHRVHYVSRRVTVGARGYGVIKRVPVQQGIDLGTPDAQIVVSGNPCTLERQPDNTWLVIAIRTKSKCATGTATDEVELDTAPDTSIGWTVNNFSKTIVPDTLFYPPFETLGMLSLPNERPPIPGVICPDAGNPLPGQILCLDPERNCLTWCDPITPPPAGGTGDRTYVGTDVGVAYTNNFLTAPPTWYASNSGLSGSALIVYKFIFDPFSSGGVLQTALQKAYIVTEDGIYKNNSLPNGTWTQVLSPATLSGMIGANNIAHNQFLSVLGLAEIVCPITHQDYVGFIATRHVATGSGWEMYWVYSLDGGANWNVAGTMPWTLWAGGDFATASAKFADVLYITGLCTVAGTGGFYLFTSIDGGATWTTTERILRESRLLFPYANSSGTPYPDDTKCYRTYDDFGLTNAVQSTTTFPTPAYPSAWTDSNLDLTAYVNTFSGLFDICTWNENYQYLLLRGPGSSLFAYTNTGAAGTWSIIAPQDVGENAIWTTLSALPSNQLFCAIANAASVGQGRIFLTLDGGATFDDRKGDINTALSSIGAINSLVPDFVFA